MQARDSARHSERAIAARHSNRSRSSDGLPRHLYYTVIAVLGGLGSRVLRPAWRLYLSFGAIVLATYELLPAGTWADSAYLVVGASTVAAICLGVRIHRPMSRTAWYLMAAGQLSWVLGDAVTSWSHDVAHQDLFPSIADVFYLAAYPMLAIALVLLTKGRRRGRDLAGLLDSAILVTGLGLLSWVLLARPTVAAAAQSSAAAGVGLAYPICDILLAGVLIRLITTPGGRTPAFRFLMCAIALLVLGDSASDAMNLISNGTSNTFALLWLGSYLAWGAAALHPSMCAPATAASNSNTEVPMRWAGLTALTIATLVAPCTLAVELMLRVRVDGWAIVTGTVLSFLLVVARMRVAIGQIISTNRHSEQLQEDLAHQAAYDSLTELPNRAQALSLIRAALSRAQRTGAILGLLSVNLDAFKAVNDTFGHNGGDEVLAAVAARMKEQLRAGDMVARLGGDEFVVLVEPVDKQTSVVDIALRLVADISEPITLADGHEVGVGASVGVATSMDGGVDASRLLIEADTALRRAKSGGRGRVEVFDESLRREMSEHAEMQAAIIAGLSADEFVVHYQPIVDAATERVQGYEALVRWDRPGAGLIAPGEFIPAAEASTLICELDCWVLRQALRQLTTWAEDADGLTMAVNISRRHLANNRIVADVSAALREAGVAANRLVLEVTETIMIDDAATVGHLQQLRALGVAISIDDFGTGYNSIAQLEHLPVDIIKIDRSFLVKTKPASGQLFELMVRAAHAFGLPVVAEGVEEPGQLAMLREVGCESAQGYHFGRPMPAAAVRVPTAARSVEAPRRHRAGIDGDSDHA
jgi:diguanylate cyclase